MSYAIIKLGGKQYRVREGERLLVDRLPHEEGATFTPQLLFLGDGETDGTTVTARVVGHVLGEKIRIGKMKPKTGYRRRTGFRSRLSQIEIEAIGAQSPRRSTKKGDAGDAAEVDEAAPKPRTRRKKTEEGATDGA